MIRKLHRFLWACLGAILMFTGSALAETKLGSYKAWTAYIYDTKDGKICSMWSAPQKAQGNYTKRGKIWAFVTHRPSLDKRNEIVFQLGYPINDKKPVSLNIDGKTIGGSYADGESVFFYSDNQQGLVNAMKRGNRMVMKATSRRGTLTTDTYSLSGFTAAYNAINKACP